MNDQQDTGRDKNKNRLYSFVIPTYSEESQIGACLDSIKASGAKAGVDLEYIVVDNGSPDATAAIATERGASVFVLSGPGIGPRKTISSLRNHGAEKAKGEVVVFLDADMVVALNCLSRAEEKFGNGYVGLLGFSDKTPDTACWVGRTWGERVKNDRLEIEEVDFLSGRNIFASRHVLDSVGLFTDELETAEDKDFTLRVSNAGFPIIRDHTETMIHLGYEKSLGEFIRKEFWRQKSTLAMAARLGYSFRSLKNPFFSFYMLLAALATVAALLLGPPVSAISSLLLFVGPTLLITLIRYRTSKSPRFLIQFFFLTTLRWVISGVALLFQLMNLARKK